MSFVVTVCSQDPSVIAGKSSFNIQRAGNTETGNLKSGTEGRQVFRGITTEAGQVQAKSIYRQPGRD